MHFVLFSFTFPFLVVVSCPVLLLPLGLGFLSYACPSAHFPSLTFIPRGCIVHKMAKAWGSILLKLCPPQPLPFRGAQGDQKGAGCSQSPPELELGMQAERTTDC